ncbi:hypothetical protein F0U59_16470 [Archangium gephyra]|nr:hypothetical protein F0U59_16470 [Archangium gephyra]
MSGKPEEALQRYREAWEHGLRTPYLLMSAASMAENEGNSKEVLLWMERAVDAGFAAQESTQQGFFKSLVGDPAYEALIQRMAANYTKQRAAQDPKLRDELLEMFNKHMDAASMASVLDVADMKLGGKEPKRKGTAKEQLKAVDAKNTVRLKEIIARNGWPTRPLVSESGNEALSALVEFANVDLPTRKRWLLLAQKAVGRGESSSKALAKETDRVLIAEGKPQRYGTQFQVVGGKRVYHPIEDEANLDARRATLGLPPRRIGTKAPQPSVSGDVK